MTLQEYINKNSTEKAHNQEYWGSYFGIARSYLSLILSGKSEPGRELIRRIAEKTNNEVPASVWFEAERK